jgi:hypothetical protein
MLYSCGYAYRLLHDSIMLGMFTNILVLNVSGDSTSHSPSSLVEGFNISRKEVHVEVILICLYCAG